MQMKTIKYHYVPIIMIKIQKTDSISYWQGCRAIGSLKENGTNTLENSLIVSYKAKHKLAIKPANHAPRYLLNSFENYVHKNLCT